ncbi:solute carrier family 22 member 13-like isoform X2 [Coccinella septempunctata]|uniref:solute carrier family 22 member 13-like isoform X2 n=1 Tax=Coccinella septempunctata TaxID=41139 RepID=UPI001D07850E|nr:solute carrier family 22 member 13-like isoform X2 [Coccinella septempunctata]
MRFPLWSRVFPKKEKGMTDENKNKNYEGEEDDIIDKAIGKFGRWQCQLTFLLALFNIPCTFHIFVPTFHGRERPVWCAKPARFSNVSLDVWIDTTEHDGYCRVNDTRNASVDAFHHLVDVGKDLVDCKKWEFGGAGETIISEFNLVCDRKTLLNMAEMCFLAGVAVGGLICGIISDKCGRKRTLLCSVCIQSLIGCSIAFVPYFELYCILRLLLGFISVSVVFSGFVLSIELVGGHWRTVAGICYLFPVSLSYMIISGLAWFLRDWRQLQFAVSAPGLLFLSLYFILPESPRWLLAMGKTDQVMKVLQTAARVNRKDLPPNIDKQLLAPDGDPETESLGVLDLFKTAEMRKKSFLLYIIWFSVYLVYYGLVLNLENIGGDLYINSVLTGLVEVPALAVSIPILIKGGRRWPLALTMIFSGVACTFIVPFKMFHNNLQWVVTTFSMMSKMSISSSNAIMPVFTAELYPTTLRNIGVGASNVTAGIALMLVPYLFELKSIKEALPVGVLAACGIIGGISVLFLPETGSRPLQDTLPEKSLESRRASRVSKSFNT